MTQMQRWHIAVVSSLNLEHVFMTVSIARLLFIEDSLRFQENIGKLQVEHSENLHSHEVCF